MNSIYRRIKRVICYYSIAIFDSTGLITSILNCIINHLCMQIILCSNIIMEGSYCEEATISKLGKAAFIAMNLPSKATAGGVQ